MKYRKLRIAWSMAWGVVAVLLVALWVRSYWWVDYAEFWVIELMSHTGAAQVQWEPSTAPLPMLILANSPAATTWSLSTKFDFYESGGGYVLRMPHLIFTGIVGLIAGVPWIGYIPTRISLRTLLIATTLVAVGLGLIIYATRG